MRRAAALVLGLLLALGVGACSSSGNPGASGSSKRPTGPLVDNCGRDPVARPALLILACADGNAYVQHLKWSTWNSTGATGTGNVEQNDCVPDCADGQFKSYAATVTLEHVTSTPAGPRFSTLVADFTGAGPNGQSTETYSLPTAPLGG